MKKIGTLLLAAVLLLSCTVTAFAATTRRSGTYGGHGYGTTDTCNKNNFYSETGSTSDYTLKTTVTYYFRALFGGELKQLTVSSSGKKSVPVEGDASPSVIKYIEGTHRIDGTIVEEVTVYS